ncbi:MAG: hypothetical protein J5524_06630 [Bacteroidaceae bacterium]|nr:hypothetical protein [Bacteroidaceae bacterium]
MKKLLLLIVLVCSMIISSVFSGCKSKPNDDLTIMDTATIIIDLDSIVLRPFLPWDAMVEDLERHMEINCSDWDIENPDSLDYDAGTGRWKRTFIKGNLKNTYYFEDAKGNYLKYVSFQYYGSMPFEPIEDEVVRNGFILQGDLRFPDYDAKCCYLYLSPSGALEVQLAGWEDGAWVLTFQPTDEEDFKYLVKKKGEKEE